MNRCKVLWDLTSIASLLGVLSTPAFGQAVGLVGGVARDVATGEPVAQAQIIAHSMDKGTDQTTVTSVDGIFTFTTLEPGPYEVAASKNGYRKASAEVIVAASRTSRVYLPLQAAPDLHETTKTPDNPPLTAREKQLLDRLERLEQRLASMEAKAVIAAQPASIPGALK